MNKFFLAALAFGLLADQGAAPRGPLPQEEQGDVVGIIGRNEAFLGESRSETLRKLREFKLNLQRA